MASLQREELFADRTLVGNVFCRAYSRRVDEWLQQIYQDRVGEDARFALLAVGGYGRSVLSPQSDLDVMLVHDNVEQTELADVSQKLWYPIWDEGLKLGHAVRTIRQAVDLAETDLDTATSFINVRRLEGDRDLFDRLAERTEAQWTGNARKWLPLLADNAAERRAAKGEIAFLLEPDLKDGSGGLRDTDAVQWADSAGRRLLEQEAREIRDAREILLAARVELHRVTGRASNVLLLEDQDEVAEALGIADADVMMREIAGAARAIAWISDDVWIRVRRSGRRRRVTRWVHEKRGPTIVAEGVTFYDGTVNLSSDADPSTDPLLVLRVAVAAAQSEARISRRALDRLAAESEELPVPWPDNARKLFTDLLEEGRRAMPIIEALDRTGSWARMLPEWEPNRNRPQRNAYHRFTVDRHLCETMSEAAERRDWVERPDLLVLGALLHDIGKGYPGDHSIVGMGLVEGIARRMGFAEEDIELLVAMVQHHLLLPDAATRLDVEDPGTIRMITEQVTSPELVNLLGALTAADSIATGPSAWSSWKAGLVRDLVDRVQRALAGEEIGEIPKQFPTDEQRRLMSGGGQLIKGEGKAITVVVPDEIGLVSKVAGALAANRLDVYQAAVHIEYDMALQYFLVEDSLRGGIDWERVEADVKQALEGKLPTAARIADRIALYGLTGKPSPAPIISTYVRSNVDVAATQTVIEVGAPDQVGLLYRITGAIGAERFAIDQARVQSLGDHVVDTFYVRDWDGHKVTDPLRLESLKQAILTAVATTSADSR